MPINVKECLSTTLMQKNSNFLQYRFNYCVLTDGNVKRRNILLFYLLGKFGAYDKIYLTRGYNSHPQIEDQSVN